MAIYHLSIKYISRRKSRSAVAAASYRSGERLYDKRCNKTYNYSNKRDIVHAEIILPSNALHEFYDRETLWNAVEEVEIREDARLAREVEIALPIELTLDEQIEITREYVTANFVKNGMCADFAIHHKIKDNPNPHSHILLTTRTIDKKGFGKKNREWDNRKYTKIWREEWANIQNREFERKGLEISVNHESYIKQGIEREPTKHLGYRVIQLEQSGIRTDRGNENRNIIARANEKEQQKLRRKDRIKNRDRTYDR